MSQLLPIFSTHYSVGHSILTAEKEEKIEADKPVSVLAIAKTHGESVLPIVDSDIAGYWKLYKNSKELGIQLVYGIKLTVCNDMSDKENRDTDSKVIVMFKNAEAYYKFVPIYSIASTEGQVDGVRRVDWKTLNRLWSGELDLLLPFYSSFLARNLLVLNSCAMPDFSIIEPSFLLESHDMPFDDILRPAVVKYAQDNNIGVIDSHQIYYYKNEDVMTYLTLQCISRRSTWQKPNVEHFGSDQFSYESYQRRSGTQKQS